MIYRININIIPEVISGVPMYFWCILGQNENYEVNCGHGWATSILGAAEHAQHYYEIRLATNNLSAFSEDSINRCSENGKI